MYDRFVGQKSFGIKEIPESLSPISVSNITFSNISEEIGPIPPPRMFSDAVISTLQAANENGSGEKSSKPGDDDEQDIPDSQTQNSHNRHGKEGGAVDVRKLIADILNFDVNDHQNGLNCAYDEFVSNYDFQNFDEWSSPFVEEVPAKEPQLTAV